MFDTTINITFGHIIEGVIGYIIVHGIIKIAKLSYKDADERFQAIWQHYQARARGQGHQSASVIACHDGKCIILAP